MKVLLAYRAPDEGADDPAAATLPAGLRTLAARLREDGHDASVANFSRLAWKQVEKFLAESAPRVVGISCFTFNRHHAVRLARTARRSCPGVTVVLGGPHASAMPALLLQRVREIDAVAVDEGEEALAEACRRVEATSALDGVPGLATRSGPVAPARLLPPERLAPAIAGLQSAGLEPARDLRHVVASRARAAGPARRSPRSVLEEIADLRAEHGLIDMSLVGPGLLDPAWLAELSEGLQSGRHPLTWDLAGDPHDLSPREDERLERALLAARGAGLRHVRITLDDDRAAALPAAMLADVSGVLRSAGVASWLTLRVGGLGEALNARWLDAMRGVIRSLRPAGGVVESRELLPGTPDWKVVAEDEGLDDAWWMDEDRPVVPLSSEADLERGAAALEVVFREVARESQPGPRDLDALEARGETARTHVDWGDFRAAHGDPDEAERRYRLAAQLEPWSAAPWLRLAALFRKGRGDAARESAALQQVVQRVPRHAPSRERLDELKREAQRSSRGRRGR